jgi:hypothetical protein
VDSFAVAVDRADGKIKRNPTQFGGVVEWLMAPVLKTGRAKALVGSNPTPSATSLAIPGVRFSIFLDVGCGITRRRDFV